MTCDITVDARRPPGDLEAWCGLVDDLARRLGNLSSRRATLELVGFGATDPVVECVGDRSGARALVEAADRLGRQLDRAMPLLVRARGVLTGPLATIALRADLLVAEALECRLLRWQDRALLLPGDVAAISARLGRAKALETVLTGSAVGQVDLVGRGGALAGPAADEAWRAALAGSPVAQSFAARLLRRGKAGGQQLERAAFALCFASGDRDEGVAAFRARRRPDFADDRDHDEQDGKR